MSTSPFDELMGIPLISLFRLALQKRARAVEEKSQDLRFRTTNTKFTRNLQNYLRARREFIIRKRCLELKQSEESNDRSEESQPETSGEPAAKRYRVETSAGEKENVSQEPQRAFKMPNILKRSHVNRSVKENVGVEVK